MLRIGTLVALLVWSGTALAEGPKDPSPGVKASVRDWGLSTEQQLRVKSLVSCTLTDFCLTYEQLRAECLNEGECI